MPTPVPQPPINRRVRPNEAHDFWPGAVVALIGILVLVGGLARVTGVETLEGDAAWETQLVRAFSVGGLKYTAPGTPTLDGAPPDPDIGPTAATSPSASRKRIHEERRVCAWTSAPPRPALPEYDESPATWRGSSNRESLKPGTCCDQAKFCSPIICLFQGC